MFAYIFERFPKFSQTFCYREIAELFRQGMRPTIFSLRAPDVAQSWDREVLAAVHQLPEGDNFARRADEAARALPATARKILRKWRGKRDSLRLHQAIYIGTRLRALGVTHLHAHFAGMAARTAFWIKEFFDIDFSVTVHANDIFAPEQFEIGLAEIFASASAIIAVSDFAADLLRQEFPIAASRIHRVYNGIDVAEFQRTRSVLPALIISIGRLITKKGFDVLIDACALLRDGEIRCEIIGDGPLAEELQARITRHNLGDCVRLAGAKTQPEIAARLSDATVFALPCRVDPDGAMDNLPTVIMEAMASALPVVSTAVGGVREMVCDRETGFVVPQNDPRATAEAISRLLEDRELAQRFGQRARERVTEVFSIEKNVRALREILSM